MLSLQRTVYKCNLYVVKDDAEIFVDKSKKSNILHAHMKKQTEAIMPVIVQPTIIPFHFKEIITGKLIPAYRFVQDIHCRDFYHFGTKSPYFVECHYNSLGFIDKYNNNLATAAEVKSYVDHAFANNNNYNKFANEIDNAISIGIANYEKAISRNGITDELAAKKLVKAAKKQAGRTFIW